jgi:hypothetical protein
MKRLLTLGFALLILSLTFAISRGAANVANPQHAYRLNFRGTAGVKVRLLLITKPTASANPERREETVTLPAKVDFKAARCYAWIDTLPEGKSGAEGDACNLDLLTDGQVSATVEMTIKKQNKQSGGLGDL